jgi:hypothetical protein
LLSERHESDDDAVFFQHLSEWHDACMSISKRAGDRSPEILHVLCFAKANESRCISLQIIVDLRMFNTTATEAMTLFIALTS